MHYWLNSCVVLFGEVVEIFGFSSKTFYSPEWKICNELENKERSALTSLRNFIERHFEFFLLTVDGRHSPDWIDSYVSSDLDHPRQCCSLSSSCLRTKTYTLLFYLRGCWGEYVFIILSRIDNCDSRLTKQFNSILKGNIRSRPSLGNWLGRSVDPNFADLAEIDNEKINPHFHEKYQGRWIFSKCCRVQNGPEDYKHHRLKKP